ncbi:MAG TPA: hypothetical protein PK498_04345 [Candidatus Kapabacteria bacterium]|nr:hypothetical protein [Candidatus Kapabacteria bacterium]
MNIDELIEKYYNGETTPAEEALLRKHFAEANEKSPEKDMFEFFSSESNAFGEIEFDESELLSKISNTKISRFPSFWKYASIAAILILAINAYIFISTFASNDNKQQYTSGIVITDENIAINKEKAALELQKAFSHLNNSQKIVNENLMNLKKLNEANNYLEILITN